MKFTKANWWWWFLLAMTACIALLAISDVRNIANNSYRRAIRDPGVIRAYLDSNSIRKLHLGAGGNDPTGWLNTDLFPTRDEVYLNAAEPYPFRDGIFQYIFSEHMIQAIPWEGGVAMLKECYRVLAPGGKLRVVTPNLAKFFHLLTGNPDADAKQFMEAKIRYHGWPERHVTGAYIVNRQVRDWGPFLYDPATLRKSFERAGFKQITEYRVDEKTDPVFREVEIRTRDEGSDLWLINRWESMAFEAVR